jgi:hypothetical protein
VRGVGMESGHLMGGEVGVADLGAEMDEGVGSGVVYQFGVWVNASLLLSSSCEMRLFGRRIIHRSDQCEPR